MKFTKEYFYEEIHRFRELMGDITAMSNSEKMDAAIKGLTLVYLNVDGIDETIPIVFDSTITEYHMRQTLLITHKLSA